MNRQQQDEPAKLSALGLQLISGSASERLRAQEDARAAEDLLPDGRRLRIVRFDD